MLTAERRQAIVQLLQEQGVVRVADLSARFGVSPSTIRRDLQRLARQGIVERSYGGATLCQVQGDEPAADPLADERARIGRAAAGLIVPGERVFLGAGQTVLAVARALAARSDLTVMTNGLSVAAYLADHSDVELIAVGGLVHRHGSAMAGHLAEQALENLHADKVVLGVQGISTPDGLTSDDLSQVRMAQMLLEAVPEAIVVADHTKFGRVCTARIAPVDRADVIVTGREAPNAMLWELAELEVRVVLA
ncbi:MAG: DeoR/GlpR transcriptional regulator [Anaerolineae bacterium]|nr:MAG: DeoR/GlpR transcriptional regulator [Anaerolineae bacterium]